MFVTCRPHGAKPQVKGAQGSAGRPTTLWAPVRHWVRGGGGYSGHHVGGSYYPSHDYPEPSLRAGSSASARYPDWYAPLERYVSYGVDQAERAMEGIGWLEHRMDDFAHVQIEMQASINSQTSTMHDLFGHFGINPDA
jgi:hypothetical protein